MFRVIGFRFDLKWNLCRFSYSVNGKHLNVKLSILPFYSIQLNEA